MTMGATTFVESPSFEFSVGIMPLIFITVGLALYVLKSLGIIGIAKSAGVNKHPVLPWVPIGRDWVLGNVADSIMELGHQKGRRYSRRLLLTGIGTVAFYVMTIMMTVITQGVRKGYAFQGTLFALLILISIGFIASIIANTVFRIVALNRIYSTFASRDSAAYLVLSATIPGAESVLLYLIRKSAACIENLAVLEPEDYARACEVMKKKNADLDAEKWASKEDKPGFES